MRGKHQEVASIRLRTDRPTELSFSDLYTWVIWQFPRSVLSGFCGAVRPPVADHGWFPAIIRSRELRVQVYGQLGKTFATPGEAADWLEKHKP